MANYDIITHGGRPALHLRTATRAGLVSSAIAGMFEVMAPVMQDESAMPHEREFSVTGKDFSELFHRLLNEAIVLGAANGEAYEGVRLTLITETEAKGALLGKAVKDRATDVAAAALAGGAIAKNEQGQWDVTMVFDVR